MSALWRFDGGEVSSLSMTKCFCSIASILASRLRSSLLSSLGLSRRRRVVGSVFTSPSSSPSEGGEVDNDVGADVTGEE